MFCSPDASRQIVFTIFAGRTGLNIALITRLIQFTLRYQNLQTFSAFSIRNAAIKLLPLLVTNRLSAPPSLLRAGSLSRLLHRPV